MFETLTIRMYPDQKQGIKWRVCNGHSLCFLPNGLPFPACFLFALTLALPQVQWQDSRSKETSLNMPFTLLRGSCCCIATDGVSHIHGLIFEPFKLFRNSSNPFHARRRYLKDAKGRLLREFAKWHIGLIKRLSYCQQEKMNCSYKGASTVKQWWSNEREGRKKRCWAFFFYYSCLQYRHAKALRFKMGKMCGFGCRIQRHNISQLCCV